MGLDVSKTMLARARELAKEAGLENVSFEHADLQTHAFAGEPFDLLFSRFGVMFFDQPQAAFANLLSALRPGGRMAFVCWRQREENQWASVMLDAVAQHIEVDMPEPAAPGPFAFGRKDGVESILTGAGFTDVSLEPHDERMPVGGEGTLDEVARNLTQFGPVSGAIRKAGVTDTSEIVASLKEAVTPFWTDAGLRMGSATWIVTGKRPG